MNWEETVMKDEEIMDCQGTTATCDDNSKAIARTQAQLTGDKAFMAGYKSGFNDCIKSSLENDFEGGKQVGIREVVEFIDNLIIGIEGCKFEERFDGDKGCIILDMNENQWQSQKKEWGL